MADYFNMPFQVKDCSLITRTAGIRSAMNLRELEERVAICPEESLFHHFCEGVIRPTFDNPDYNNDFALWAGRYLDDHTLAERLAVINPYRFESLEHLRRTVLDIIQERLTEVEYIPWAPKDNPFYFLRAVTVVFETGMLLNDPTDFCQKLSDFSYGSIYYHFVEARRRTEQGKDDFTAWLEEFDGVMKPLIEALNEIDFYFMPLHELKRKLIDTVGKVEGVNAAT